MYEFTQAQAAVVGVLWEAREHNTPTVNKATLLNAIPVNTLGSNAEEVSHLFRKHPAWKSMIVSSNRGSYRLADPPDESTNLENPR